MVAISPKKKNTWERGGGGSGFEWVEVEVLGQPGVAGVEVEVYE